ncbi:zinc-dependent metalloprotease [Rugamonas sp.]|uniref:zinc-dependent metalloprotease n=1 Tax=Rugamonas sp. TaxID=1926287 RepID=UPI0025F9E852|nr:zinc-dependent metalloprotease [Rugamonas sp.]
MKSVAAAVSMCFGVVVLAQEPAPLPPAPPTPAPHVPEAPAAVTPQQQAAALLPAALQALGAPKSYLEVTRGATHLPGFFSLYQKEEKVWIELRPDQFDHPFFMSVNMSNGIGERGIYGGQMLESHVVYFHRLGNLVQLIAKNTGYGATPDTPQALQVEQAYSNSLLATATAPVASGPQAHNHAVLVEANALLFGDIPGIATRLEAAYRLPFAIDARNTSFASLRADEAMTGLQVSAHFSVAKIPAPPAPAALPASPQMPLLPTLPSTLPDPRSMFLGFYYSFMPLPEQLMHPRAADDRIGHFVTTGYDYSDDLHPSSAIHLVHRWRLEKLDPSLPLSAPKQPIVYWLDKNIPEKYRQAVSEGVLAWNAAFEKIGFKDAIVVRQQAAQDRFDTLDARHASIRWFIGRDASFAIGPSQVDPRSGEILDADIGMSELLGRNVRRIAGEDLPPATTAAMAALPQSAAAARCDYAMASAQEFDFAAGLLEARGDLAPDSPQAEALAQSYVRAVIMHEVGHTLGLRHNFRASTVYTARQLADPEFTKLHGLAGSVMDYAPFNLAAKGERQGAYVPAAPGPYDDWAIEYAYAPLVPEQEKEQLARIAARSNEPLLAFGDDGDAMGSLSDPDVNAFDLGSDPLAYFQKRLTISRELWDRLQTRQFKPGDSYASLRRSFDAGFGQFAGMVPVVVKYVGGVSYVRDHAGTGRATFTPVPLARQRAALAMLTNNLFKADSFRFTPALVSRLGADQFGAGARADVSINAHVLSLQAAALAHLMSDPVALRLQDSQEKADDGKKTLDLDELYGTLQAAIWSELKTGRNISGMRRNLQREHLKRIEVILLHPTAQTPADARSLQRAYARELLRDLRAALPRAGSREVKAHLDECFETLNQALRASMVRAIV